MHPPPSVVQSWPPIVCQAECAPKLHFSHLGTEIEIAGDPRTQRRGQTCWWDSDAQPAAAVAWEWVQLQPGVVALANPLGVKSNLRLLDASGAVLSSMLTTLRLNEIVHSLPWQREVEHLLEHYQG